MRVTSSGAVLLLLLPIAASAASPTGERPGLGAAERRIAVTTRARSFSHDRLGNNWVFHGVDEVPGEVEAAAVSLIRPNGTVRTYFASDLLPQGTIYAGKVGQIYTISPMTTPGYYAATVGYISREHYTRNALVVFALDGDGEPRTIRVISLRNSAQVIGGPRDTLVVTAVDPTNMGSFTRATVFDFEGNVHAELLPFNPADVMEASRMEGAVRLQQSGADDFAVYDPDSKVVRHYSLAGAGSLPVLADAVASPITRPPQRAMYPEIELIADWQVSIANPAVAGNKVELERLFDFAADAATRNVTVARNVLVDGVPHAVVNRYDGQKTESWMAEGPWNATLWQRESVLGSGPQHGVVEQRVSVKKAIVLLSTERQAAAPAREPSGCTSWMTGRQCAQLFAPEPTIADIRKLRSIAPLVGPGEGCVEDPSYYMCTYSITRSTTSYKLCNADGGRVVSTNCSIDYCEYNACYPVSCAQDATKVCCPEEPPVTTTRTPHC